MLDKLNQVAAHYEQLEARLASPEVTADPAALAELMKEYKSLTPLYQKIREYQTVVNEAQDARLMLESESDAEMKGFLQETMQEAEDAADTLRQEIQIMLLPQDPRNEKSVILEIRSGAGGEEAALFVNSLARMYNMYAAKMGWRMEVINANPTELGGYKEISFSIDGEGAYSRLKFESGVHRVQRVPETETQGRVHTSTVTVAVLAEADEVELEIDPTELKIDTFRSSGAGGQHINKTESAIRITHLPTGMVVECQDERSQYKNKDKAMKVLRARLLDRKQREQAESIAAERKNPVGTGDRSERIRTYNYPQGRISDHRIGLTIYKLDNFLNGDLDEVIDALTADHQTKLLAGQQAADNG